MVISLLENHHLVENKKPGSPRHVGTVNSDILLLPEDNQRLFDEVLNLIKDIDKGPLKWNINLKINCLYDKAKSNHKELESHHQAYKLRTQKQREKWQ